MCPVLVTGLGGLYSVLPNSIEITALDWHRITPDDVAEIPELNSFINALEFCNALVQVAHSTIVEQLLDFMYAGFIVPILGPAILQVFTLVVFVNLRFVVGVCTKSLCCVNSQCLQVVVHIRLSINSCTISIADKQLTFKCIIKGTFKSGRSRLLKA